MSRATVLVALTFLTVALLAALGGAAASPQPTPFCPVCGTTLHEDVTATDATLQVQTNGDVRWHVENEVSEPTATAWTENPGMAEATVNSVITPPPDPIGEVDELTVTVDDGTVTIEFVDRGAARHRLGLLVVPYLHGEGRAYRWVINADRLVVEAPDGQRVVNDPSGATVEDGRAVWRGTTDDPWEAPEPGDTYVVIGSGAGVDTRASVVTGVEPLDPGLYGYYAVGLLFVTGVAFGLYTVQGTRLGRRRVAAGVAVTALPYLYVVASLHPPQAGGLGGFFERLLAAVATVVVAVSGGTALYVWAAVADSRAGETTT